MKRIVCAAMALVMLVLSFALVSCSNTGKEGNPASDNTDKTIADTPRKAELSDVVGTWSTDVPAVQFIFPGDKWDTASYEWSGDLHLSIVLNKEGGVILGLRKSDVRDFVKENLTAALAMFDYTLEFIMKEGNYGTEDEVVDAMVDTFTSLNKTGKFTCSDGVMTTELVSIAHDHSNEEGEEVLSKISVEVSGDTITFKEYVEEGGEHALFDPAVLPITFTKSSGT